MQPASADARRLVDFVGSSGTGTRSYRVVWGYRVSSLDVALVLERTGVRYIYAVVDGRVDGTAAVCPKRALVMRRERLVLSIHGW